jgi:hydroxyacyl-ACP dehydratase HTD2-like protein with hotdog domain
MPNVASRDLTIGQQIGPLLKTPTNVTMFMYSATVWLVHRIHYDRDFAVEHEALPDVVAHGTLATDWLAQLLLEWAGAGARLARLSYQIRSYMLPNETLSCGGSITQVGDDNGERCVELDVWIVKPDGVQAASGSATVMLPASVAS